jgi:nitroreductase
MIDDLIRRSRSCRRFYQNHAVSLATLKDLVNLGRLSPSAANLQPLKYILCTAFETNAAIFPCLGWAGYLKTWEGPQDGERPSAYIVVLGDTQISKNFDCDLGIASQSIMLGAREMGLAGCMIGSIKKSKLKEILSLDERYKILLVLAIGKPKEEVVIEAAGPEDSIQYWRDMKGIHHVPKRNLNDIITASYDIK